MVSLKTIKPPSAGNKWRHFQIWGKSIQQIKYTFRLSLKDLDHDRGMAHWYLCFIHWASNPSNVSIIGTLFVWPYCHLTTL
jgi:hypothetical protein